MNALGALAIYGAAVLLLVLLMVAGSYVLGSRHEEHATDDPYECGIVSTGGARLRFSPHFYMVAMLFVLFDLEAVFLYAWAVALRELGWPGYFGALVFLGVLVIALAYEWRVGALDFGPRLRVQPDVEEGD